MQNSPTVATRAQEVGINNDGDLMIFGHFGIMRRVLGGFQEYFGLPYSNWPTTRSRYPLTKLLTGSRANAFALRANGKPMFEPGFVAKTKSARSIRAVQSRSIIG
jgi:hypothetical protein